MANVDPTCAARGIPEYLHTGTRPAVPSFADAERLFIRFRGDERKLKAVLNFRRQSANRELFCPQGAADALYHSEAGGHYEGWGVAAVSVGQLLAIQERLAGDMSERFFTLRPTHAPVRCNYAHAEIVACEGGEEVVDIQPKSVKKRMREALRDAVAVVLPTALSGTQFELD